MKRSLQDLALWAHILQYLVPYKVHVESEPVCPWVLAPVFLFVASDTVCGSDWVGNTGGETLVEDVTVPELDSTLGVDVELGEGHHLGELELGLVGVVEGQWVCLVTASPDDKVGPLDVLQLFLRTGSFHKLDSPLPALHDVGVELLSVTTKSCEAVDVALLAFLFEVLVVVLLGLLDVLIEHLDLLPI